eukprot:CAMPEP_0197623166 /NCGR_PEP_ID=MMETSP1338-20131121/3225_1 /TAXON_ID=43686 ORGANISM="Pelagodinium beii, Strain RCC1491" /NCGR_SAMPLE_ID=MMETSP1338 /ASSEMBLY_ACC=CAM_ASM_000754 /LENGTH=872 /DNA_ID=CAMNT_0043193047 /DNA_START=127 /DNA_END=2742 /DNA_ORIENTATION=+
MEVLAGAAAGGLAAKEAYCYNRENFMYDRELRRRKEFNVQNFRVEQAELWRKDVRDLISLTEYKMHVYLLVNVLLLSGSVIFWCQGKLEGEPPAWLVTGNALAITGGFMFILLSVWLAMHAAVTAQSFETRLLTQMVRLPIPTWQEIEACRTYASEFERLESSQMFRVPFAMGRQENLVPVREEESDETADRSETATSTLRRGQSTGLFRSTGSVASGHVDPWGLEGSGANIQELGCKQGSNLVRMRHVKLARQAMVFWQSYDAFARISMSIGVNSILLAGCYFILAYYLAEVKVASSATYGVILLTAMGDTLNQLDLTLTWRQLRLMQLLHFAGPGFATAAGWAFLMEDWYRLAELLVVCAFLAHAAYLTLINSFCRSRMEHNGTMLPVAFRSVLYLDVFGWASQGSSDIPRLNEPHTPSEMSFRPRVPATPTDLEDEEESFSSTGKPAADSIRYADGVPVPTRPEQAARPDAADDYSGVAGAADPEVIRDPDTGRRADFFQAGSWLGSGQDAQAIDDEAVATGHEHEAPLILPWKTFSFAMNLYCLSWLAAAVYHALDAAHFFSEVATYSEEAEGSPQLLEIRPGVSMFAAMHQESFASKEDLMVTWAHRNVMPHGLACDAAGTRFIASDGVSIFTAELERDAQEGRQRTLIANFKEVECPPVLGESLLDVAVACPLSGSSCEALVLHKYGNRMASCALGESANDLAADGYKADVSDAWLEEFRVGRGTEAGQPHARIEKAVSLASDSGCQGQGDSNWAGCVLLGTTRGRVVRLASRTGRNGMLSPVQALLDREATSNEEPWKPGTVRSFGDQHWGVLSHNGTAVRVWNKADGHRAGTLFLEGSKAKANGFCIGGEYVYFMNPGPSPGIW